MRGVMHAAIKLSLSHKKCELMEAGLTRIGSKVIITIVIENNNIKHDNGYGRDNFFITEQ